MEPTKLRTRFIQEAEHTINRLNVRERELEADLADVRAERDDARATLTWLKSNGKGGTEAVRRAVSGPAPSGEHLEAARVLTEEQGGFTTNQFMDLTGVSLTAARSWLSRAVQRGHIERREPGVYAAHRDPVPADA
jgi:hypothetical protein